MTFISSAPYRILVTGWRSWPETAKGAVWSTLTFWAERAQAHPVAIVHGKANGVDKWADEWALDYPFAEPERHPADWDRYGKQAGMLRNRDMVELGANLCLAFPGPGSIGTMGCLTRAIQAGIPTFTLPYREDFA